ncbi:MAG: hypothetical protein EPO45_12480 [Sphingobium sp.]|jgi:hypothetical protein|uniref:Phage shock protein B n=1 Tax=Sphingobium xenophagum TaxID=121428 RepID=A0A249MR47_SPHXE|nr:MULTISPECIES: hypothetical protein [Sphingobium]MBU0660427.1 hypothetical protein [Alphaproteobacteria bacterium]ASY43820.1 hypothetical protein CJD35_04670 [Sphingobium xenophagum]MBA4756088.1 hypothetical protein [Sphingobium sp.]MBG6118090.1 hypothetical protein [Sphingobium sp. JAI105]MBS89764.1 hypothetical protein [Sphingobium sp.]|tara:strand:+ start:2445 stop:2696 length:252 start_codon:yes stop_codon:yes gene_type:complete
MNPFEMVVAIIAITAIASVLRAKYGVVRRHKGEEFIARGPDPEAERLRAEVKALKDRVAVLERLATDGTSALEREFEKLRDRD